MFNILLTVHRDIPLQYELTGWTIYFQFISVINLYILFHIRTVHIGIIKVLFIHQLIH